MAINKVFSHALGAAVVATLIAFTCSSCDSVIYDDLAPCPQGVNLRFVYEYNMEYANEFPSQVDCLTLYVYDSQGNFVTKKEETSSLLADPAYRMTLDLEPGDYHLVAYGGIACSSQSFYVVDEPAVGTTLSSLGVYLPTDGGISSKDLHALFFGDLDVKISKDTQTYDEATVEMMKDTNHLRVKLYSSTGKSLSSSDYSFTLTDDNTRFDYMNNIVSIGTTTYLPYSLGDEADTSNQINVYADLSISRLWTGNAPNLKITQTDSGLEVVNIPLNEYLLMLKSEQYSSMGDQEFLDREDEWELEFSLDDSGIWLSTYIVINGWVVRLNNPSLK